MLCVVIIIEGWCREGWLEGGLEGVFRRCDQKAALEGR